MGLSDYLPSETTTIWKGGRTEVKKIPPKKNVAEDIKNLVSSLFGQNSKKQEPTPTPTSSPTPTPSSFGIGLDEAKIEPKLWDALMKIPNKLIRMKLAELSGQESSYGYAGPHLSEEEQSYGPYHINLLAGRINPETNKPFTQAEASDPEIATRYALSEYMRTGGLGSWNPGSYNFYQYDLPTRSATKKYMKGQ